MTDRFERRLPEILIEISVPQVPDYFDDILGLTAQRQQRPGWSFPGRWLPMDIAAPHVGVGRTPWRAIAIVVLLILAVAATIAYLGSRPTRLAPFYGPAANGSLIYGRLGDIYIADRDLRAERVLIGGDTEDIGMRWSLDGGTIYFGRVIDGRTVVLAADPDGSNVRELSTALAHVNDGVQVSPDGSRLVAISLETTPATLEVVALDGSNTKRTIDTGDVVPVDYVQWRPPDAEEIVFLGHPDGSETELALYRIRRDGSGMTELARSGVRIEDEHPATLIPFVGIVLSDDGDHAAFTTFRPDARPSGACRVHLVDLDDGGDRTLTYDVTADCETEPRFLADGRIIFEYSTREGMSQLHTAPLDGGVSSRIPGYEVPVSLGEWDLAPDRETVLWVPYEQKDGPPRLIDIDTGESRNGAVHLPVNSSPSWQRLAP